MNNNVYKIGATALAVGLSAFAYYRREDIKNYSTRLFKRGKNSMPSTAHGSKDFKNKNADLNMYPIDHGDSKIPPPPPRFRKDSSMPGLDDK